MKVFRLTAIAAACASIAIPLTAQSGVLEEVVVTAQKREESVQDVPIAISAFTGDQMRQLGYTNAQQVTAMAPGVSTVQPNGEANYALGIRGVAASDFTTNVESPVALYLDEVYISQMSGAGFQLYDMERVEILRGPQGTLFGRNATGGLAHFISAKPTQELDGYVEATYADYDQTKVEGAISGGSDMIQARVSGVWNEADGYVDNRLTGGELNNQDDQAWRAHLQFTPSDDLTVLLTARQAEQDIDTGFFEHVTSIIPGKLTPNLVNPILEYIDNDGDPYAGDYDRTGFNRLETDGYTATINWSFGDLNFTSITDKSTVEREYAEDSDASPAPVLSLILNTDAEQFTQEFRLDGETDSVKWVGGLYYMELDIDDNNGIISTPFLGCEFGEPGDPECGLINPYTSELESWSVFGQADITISDELALTVGARYIDDSKDFKYSTEFAIYEDPNASDLDGANISYQEVIAAYQGEIDSQDWSGKVQLTWTPNDDLLIYGGWNRGVRGGGGNAPIFPLSPPLDYTDEVMTYDPETLDAFEVGFKATFADGLVRLNGAAYYYDYQDYQAFNIIGIDTITFNTDAESSGAELELLASPMDGLDLLLGASYNDIEVDLPDGASVPSVQSPEFTWNAMARYEFDIGGAGTVAMQIDAMYRDEHFFALNPAETVREDGYTLTNASITWNDASMRWQLRGFVNNLTDEEYLVQTFDLSGPDVIGMTEQYFGRPRWWGVSLRYSFGS